MIRKTANTISKRYVLISLILVGLIGLFMILVFSQYFSDMANGYPYMETKFGFLPDDLFEMAEGYGAAGRSLYIKSALSLDLLVPLLGANFLTSLALYLMKKNAGGEKRFGLAFALGLASCLSDWLENLAMIGVITTYEQPVMAFAIMARVMTTIKYLAVVIFAAVIVREIYLILISDKKVK